MLRFSVIRLNFQFILLTITSLAFLGVLQPRETFAARIRNESNQMGYIQFWNVCPSTAPFAKGTISGSKLESPQPLGPFAPSYLGPYSPLPPGNYQIQIQVGEQTLPRIPIKIDRMKWFTILVQPDEKGKYAAQVIDDTYIYKAGDPGTITVRNFTTNGEVSCGTSDATLSPLMGLGNTRVFANFSGKSGIILAYLKTAKANRVRTSEIPLSFTECKRWAIIFLNDTRERIVPKIAPLGYNASEFQEYIEVSDDYATQIGQGTGVTPTPTP